MLAILKRDLLIYYQKRQDILSNLLFFVIICSLVPIALQSASISVLWLAPAVIWIAALLSSLLAQEYSLREDFKLGLVAQMLLSNKSLSIMLLEKIFAHWLACGLPLAIIAPFLALSFAVPFDACLIMAVTLLIGTLCISALSMLASSLLLASQKGGVLLAIIVLPLYIPIMCIGSMACVQYMQGYSITGYVSLLLAVLLFTLTFLPYTTSVIVKSSIE